MKCSLTAGNISLNFSADVARMLSDLRKVLSWSSFPILSRKVLQTLQQIALYFCYPMRVILRIFQLATVLCTNVIYSGAR